VPYSTETGTGNGWRSTDEGRSLDRGCYIACLVTMIGAGMVLSGLTLFVFGEVARLGPPGMGEELRIAGPALATAGLAILVAVVVLSWKNRVR